MQKLEMRNFVVHNLSSAPSSPGTGQMWYDTANNLMKWRNDSAWIDPLARANHSGTQTASTISDFDTAVGGVSVGGDMTGTVGSMSYAAGSIVNADINASAAIALSKLATDPLARANHTGTQAASTISDLSTVVQAYRLDQFAAPNAAVSFNSQRLTNLANPSSGTDAVNRNYVDNAVQGLDQKNTATVATDEALPASTYANGTSGVGATLTGDSNGALTVDDYAVATGDHVLVKDQVDAEENGLYLVTQPGDGSNPFILTRSTDMDTSTEFKGALVPVGPDGAVNSNSLWLQSTTSAITVGTTDIGFTQIAAPSSYVAGDGIDIVGTTISADVGTGLTLSGGEIVIDTTITARKVQVQIGDNSAKTFDVTHSLGNRGCVVEVWRTASPYDKIDVYWEHLSTTQIRIIFDSSLTAPTSNEYTVTMVG